MLCFVGNIGGGVLRSKNMIFTVHVGSIWAFYHVGMGRNTGGWIKTRRVLDESDVCLILLSWIVHCTSSATLSYSSLSSSLPALSIFSRLTLNPIDTGILRQSVNSICNQSQSA